MSEEEVEKAYRHMMQDPLKSICDIVNNLSKLPDVPVSTSSEDHSTNDNNISSSLNIN